MGKKYIIELLDDCQSEFKGIMVFGVTQEKQISVELIPEESLRPYTEPEPHAEVTADAYQRGHEAGLNDAWETARKIWQPDIYLRIFKVPMRMDCFTKFSASEAIEKIRQYEQKKEEIKVGDEVIPRETEYDTMIVTRLWKDDYDSDCIDAIGFDGRISSFLVSRVSKTGKHYEIAAVLEKMREDGNQNRIQETMSDDY